ncbi:MAG: dihydrolipoyl dehydrogenase [Dehalococcoidia bacterium]|nr:dihydrolipoyl dehydrogenase [Dehalococcoidia bacterium]|tara:strand:- start:359 stop:1735 length:1377 start_codon:yes stop_codon:yes gene_type:complete
MADFDLIVIGAGPGGYVAAIRGGQLGLKTAVVEKDEVGGICLNWGCIPSKSLLKNAEIVHIMNDAQKWGISFDNFNADYSKAIDRSRQVVKKLTGGVNSLLKKNKVTVIKGEASFQDSQTITVGSETYTSSNFIIATGARARTVPSLPIDGEAIITSREALELTTVPKRIAIVGGGATGVEFAYIYNAYGAQVTLIEMLPNILPNEDHDISQELKKSLTKQGITVATDTKVSGMSSKGKLKVLELVTGQNDKTSIEVDKVLVAIGVQGNIEGLNLESIGVNTDRTYITVDDDMKTGIDGIFAIGDVTGKMLLAHVAQAQAILVVENIASVESPPLDYNVMPKAVYANPQVASFGITEQKAKEEQIEYHVGRFPFAASGKAIALGETEGFIKLIISEHGEILGAHLIGHEVTELLGELSLANLLEGTTEETGWLVHSHPSISEVIKEAALQAEGKAIHI